MRFAAYFFVQCIIILCNQNDPVGAKALIGKNVKRVRPNEYNFIVSIQHINGLTTLVENNHDCTGVLVSTRHVLTSAHCLSAITLNNTVIIVGSVDLNYGRNYYPLFWISYDRWISLKNKETQLLINDIAVIKLSLEVAGYIRPVQLSTKPVVELYGLNVVTAGWGVNMRGNINKFLESVVVNVIPHDECEEKIFKHTGQRIAVGENILCTMANPYALLCDGDSGGPLLYRNKIIGINKGLCLYQNVPFHPNKINMHISTKHYNDFIIDVIQNF